MPLPLLARLTATNPARQFGLYPRKGALQPGADADLAIVDLEGCLAGARGGPIPAEQTQPVQGMTLRGTVERTLVRGVTVFDRSTFPVSQGHGQLLRR